jgi:hypothetical protein
MFPAIGEGDDASNHLLGDSLSKLADGRWLDRQTGEISTVGPKKIRLTISGGLLRVNVNDVRNEIELDEPEPDDVDQPAKSEEAEDSNIVNVVDGFSRRSRNRCRAAAASLDWAEAHRSDLYLLMVTCTYPKEWRECAPTPDHVTRHRRALELRYLRAVGHPLAVMWKREFQARGAPHLHLFGWWPWTVGGLSIQSWLSANWYQIVDSGDPLHELAGTGVDHLQSLRMSDPARVGNYFASYASSKGDKEYQNHAPQDWTNDNGSVGRYWGYVGLQRLGAEVLMTPADMVSVQRLLRGVLGAQKRTHRSRFSNKGVGPDGLRRRKVNRRYKLGSLTGVDRGFTFLTNDGAALAFDVARALALPNAEPWPKGQPRPLP